MRAGTAWGTQPPGPTGSPGPAVGTGTVAPADVEDLTRFLAPGQGAAGDVMVLTGAGMSTASGIPDYRGPTGRARRATPMQYRDFVADPAARQRYWARSHVGWAVFGSARPNAGHVAVARLQRAGQLGTVVTQNVDGLHQAGGSTAVVDLHGRLDRVVCLGCREVVDRGDHDDRLRAANPGFLESVRSSTTVDNADGDAVVDSAALQGFSVVACPRCGGVLKPDVVFFGENVPRERVQRCYALTGRARALLVLGSSLTVMSGLRFVRAAAAAGTPVAVVNQGPTRGDELATVRLEASLVPLLTAAAARLDA